MRGGGHSFPGHSVCDGFVIDLSLMKGIQVDAEARTARVGAGGRGGELDAATQEHGPATVGGIVTHTGVAGLTLGGGIGWLQRKHGLTIDQLVSADLVTADGEEVTASADENPERFWGLRGGGGNFGVVTEFEFRLHPVGPMVLAGPVFWPMSDSPEVLRFYRDWIRDVPDELMTIVMHRSLPAADFVPSELHGAPVVGITCCYAGGPGRGGGSRAAAQGARKPRARPLPTEAVPRAPGHVRRLVPARLVVLPARLRRRRAERRGHRHHRRVRQPDRSPLTAFPIWQLGGAVARVADDANGVQRPAAGTRSTSARPAMAPRGSRRSGSGRGTSSRRSKPHQTSVYVNFLWEEGQERVREAYGAEKYDRLQALKRKYDPDNLFRLNQKHPAVGRLLRAQTRCR